MEDGACADMGTDLFFPDHSALMVQRPTKKVQAAWDRAKLICHNCPVMKECGRDSIGEVEGVWGGIDPHQRHLLRRRRARALQTMPPAKRAEYARLAYYLYLECGYSCQEASRIMGIGPSAVKDLSYEHKAALKERAARTSSPAGPGLKKARWPSRTPPGADGWVRYCGRVVSGHYLGQTEDGQWYSMRVRLSQEPSTAWFKAEDVRMTRDTPVVILERVGSKGSRIYGTTISEGARSSRAKAG